LILEARPKPSERESAPMIRRGLFRPRLWRTPLRKGARPFVTGPWDVDHRRARGVAPTQECLHRNPEPVALPRPRMESPPVIAAGLHPWSHGSVRTNRVDGEY